MIGTRPNARFDGTLPTAMARVPLRGHNYHDWLQRHAVGDARSAGAALAHYTNAAAPVLRGPPFVLTVHDLSLLRHPQMHPLARLVTLPVGLAAIARAQMILVPSRFTERQLGRLLPAARRRVTVVEYAAPDHMRGRGAGSAALDRLGLVEGSYLLSVGTVEPRKNHRRLIGAFERVARDRPNLRLVIVGARGWRSDGTYRRVDRSPLRDRIILTGYVDDADMAALIRGSAAVCYVSLYEGFGLPIVEAMAVGAAVVTSRRTSMPQVAGRAGVLVDPLDEMDIARGIEEAMAHRSALVAAGRTRTGGRTWRDVAHETVEVYCRALRWAR